MDVSETLALVKNCLEDGGYQARIRDGNFILSAASGLKFYIQVNDGDIQFRCGMTIDQGTGRWLEFANSINVDVRFSKIYIEDDESIVLEADWWFDPDSSNHPAQFQRAMELWELSLGNMKQKLRLHLMPSDETIDENSPGHSSSIEVQQ